MILLNGGGESGSGGREVRGEGAKRAGGGGLGGQKRGTFTLTHALGVICFFERQDFFVF